MLLHVFLIIASGLNLGLGVVVQIRSYRKYQSLWFLGISALITFHLWISRLATLDYVPADRLVASRVLFMADLLIGYGILQIARSFFQGSENNDVGFLGLSGKRPWRVLLTINGVALATAFSPWGSTMSPDGQSVLTFVGSIIPAAMLLNTVSSLFLLENTYRFAQEYQRRIGRLVFIGLFWMCGFHMLAFGRALLYRTFHPHYPEASSVVYGVVFPVVLLGFLRYRLGAERISIPRDTVYSSLTLFMTGAVFLAVALTVMVFQALDVNFTQFELYLVGFSLCFVAVLTLGSGTMRRRISRFVNARLYSSKYDYQEQFFRLNQVISSEGDVARVVTDLIENMKYSVTVDDAFCFFRNAQDGNFYVHQNKEASFPEGLRLSGDSPLIRALEEDAPPLDFKAAATSGGPRLHEARGEPMLLQMGIDAAFAIRAGGELAGVLCLHGGRHEPLDGEDLALVSAFATSIGDVVLKSKVMATRIESKQFESFHHVASFIIHDIKNQIATLNLVVRNADRNIENPAFQKSMLSSVRSSATALQELIDRLSVAPRQPELRVSGMPLRPLLEAVVQNSALAQVPELAFTLVAEESSRITRPDSGAVESLPDGLGVTAQFDRDSLFFVVKNLIQNALEAMGNQGDLALRFGSLIPTTPAHVRSLTGGGERFFAGFGAYVLVTDNGPGMDPDFVAKKLFQPFITTKEKGVGIGLYQCRTLIEKMGGRILCKSEKGVGTTFCLLLPAVVVGPG